MQQKQEFITRQIRKFAREIGALADDIDNHQLRAKFYAELLKNKIFEIYEANTQLIDLIQGNTGIHTSQLTNQQSVEIKPMEKPEQEQLEIVPDIKVGDEIKPETLNEIKEEPTVEEFKRENKHEDLYQNEPENENVIEERIENSLPVENQLKEFNQADLNNTIHTEQQIEENKEIPNDVVENKNDQQSETSLFPNELAESGKSYKSSQTKEETWLYKNLLNTLDKKNKSNDIAERKQDLPVSTLNNAISISLKHEFISSLFAGDTAILKDSIQKIESMNSFDEAIIWMENELSEQYNWKKNEKLSFEFTNLVRRRFL